MEFLIVLFSLLYIVIGYGFDRTMERVTDTPFGKDCQNNFMTMVFWPFILVMIAFNRELVHPVVRPTPEPAQPEVSFATL